ncbi:flagellar motor protein [Candidatus Korobacter versatilis]|uniref:flagellar motor protein n=1 Tax=Candidatus Korobacter versatilis TaxID=658062 RepID=UPI00030A8795|nr:flagellar motor protein [Candidatus Koribacter versatilis]
MDKGTFGGVLAAVVGIVAGLLIEGGKISQILQPTAALIVFGGTLGAVMVQFPFHQFLAAARATITIFRVSSNQREEMLDELVRFAYKARKQGIVSLDSDLDTINDSFLKRALMLAVDGTAPGELRKMMELELDQEAEKDERTPQVFEAAGGYSPTIGIIGAVLGLIQVMQHLQNIDEVGRGIAVAFVATIYGVAAANIFFLPAAGKLRIRVREAQLQREMAVEGVIALLEGMNPRMLETRLSTYVDRGQKVEAA